MEKKRDTEPAVAIIVLHSKNVKDTSECLDSLLRTDYNNMEILVVNNNDSKEAIDNLKKSFPTVKVVSTDSNLGHAEGCNFGYRHASASCKYVVFLDNDVTLDHNWLRPMVEFCENDDTIGACQPKLLQFQNPELFEYNGGAGGYLDPFAYTVIRGRIFYEFEKDEGQWNSIAEVFWAGGCCVLVRRKCLEEVGLYDSSFFLYFDEIDLCWRLRLAGYKIFCIPSSIVYHKGGGKRSKLALYYKHRNNIIMMIKNYDRLNLIRYGMGRFFMDISAIPLNGISVLRAYGWILLNLRSILKSRRKVQQIRSVHDNHIRSFMIRQPIILLYYVKKLKTFSQILELNPHIYRTFR